MLRGTGTPGGRGASPRRAFPCWAQGVGGCRAQDLLGREPTWGRTQAKREARGHVSEPPGPGPQALELLCVCRTRPCHPPGPLSSRLDSAEPDGAELDGADLSWAGLCSCGVSCVLSSRWLGREDLTAPRGTPPHFPVFAAGRPRCAATPGPRRCVLGTVTALALRGLPGSCSGGFWGLPAKACLTWRLSWVLRDW